MIGFREVCMDTNNILIIDVIQNIEFENHADIDD